jgi:hypothetical protein
MASTDDGEKAEGGPRAKQTLGFRIRYISERLRELSAERERLIEERKALIARRDAGETGE